MPFVFSSPKPSPAGEGLRANKSTLNGDIAKNNHSFSEVDSYETK